MTLLPRSIRVLAIAGLFSLSTCSVDVSSFESRFESTPDRVWIGPDYFANRMLDWRIRDGRLEAVEGDDSKPMRTVHLLTHYLTSDPGNLEMQVRTGSLQETNAGTVDTWTGFLLGAGGDDIDFRISALVHHWPAPGGGLIVGVDGSGSIIVRNNENPDALRGARSDFTTADWPAMDPVESMGRVASLSDVQIGLRAEPSESGFSIVVTASNPSTGEVAAMARYDGLDVGFLEGNIALVSHGSTVEGGEGYWFRDWKVSGSKVGLDPSRAFGPVMGTMYTLSDHTLKMTAQMGPIGPGDHATASLQIRRGLSWKTVAEGSINPNGYTIPFRIDDWSYEGDVDYRVAYELAGAGSPAMHYYSGTIRTHPRSDTSFVLAAMNCQNVSGGDGTWTHNHIWFPHSELARAVQFHQPDMLFFAGDQIYEGGIAGIIRTPTDQAILDYLYHWYRFVWSFRDLMRDLPTVAIPDDHDVYHGNIWGEGGKAATGPFSPFSDNGGYGMDPEFVNAVHRTQTSHLPDPVDPTPIQQDISVYYTTLNYGGVSFAILADRMWKSAPRGLLPDAQVVNGWPQNPNFDAARQADIPSASLLGDRQLDFLEQWTTDWSSGTWMKVVLSQTLFSDVATIPADAMSGAVLPGLPVPKPGERITTYKLAADMDSGGWPQSGRNRALRAIRKGLAFHVAGDQHLGSVVQYGIDEWNDASFGFVVPSIANIWPRRWFPPTEGGNREPGSSWYTGEHLDGFGNKMTVHAAANPVISGKEPSALYDRTPGYGILRMNRETRQIVMEAWPRWVDPAAKDAQMYTDWPVEFSQFDNDGRMPVGFLPEIVSSLPEPVVTVTDATTNEHLYTVRIVGQRFRPKVFVSEHEYTVTVSAGEEVQTFDHLSVTADNSNILSVEF